MQSSTGQYSTHAGEPAQPVQHSVITASSFGFFLRGVVIPLERGSCFNASGTIPATRVVSDPAAMLGLYPRFRWICYRALSLGIFGPAPACRPGRRRSLFNTLVR